MSIKKSILYLLVSLLIAGQTSAAIQIKGKFKNWESHFTKQGDDLICFASALYFGHIFWLMDSETHLKQLLVPGRRTLFQSHSVSHLVEHSIDLLL